MIKRTFLLAFSLMLVFTSTVFSQDLKFGFEAGFDVANAQMIYKPDNFPKMFYPMIAFNVNGYIGYKSSGFWGLSAEPGYVQKGGRQKYTDGYLRYQLNYIQLPVLAELYITDKIFFSVGPEFGYMINAKVKSGQNSNGITDFYNRRFELSGQAGINYRIYDKLDIGLRYNHGLMYIQKITLRNEFGDQMGEVKNFNQYFQLMVRFKI